MSGITDDQRKSLIIAEVGDENGVLVANIDLLWEKYSWMSLSDANLRDLYVKKECILLVMGTLRNSVDIAISFDSTVSEHQRITTLEFMLRDVNTEITNYIKSVAQVGVSMGQLIRETPDGPPPYGLDANNPIYSGTPYYRGRL